MRSLSQTLEYRNPRVTNKFRTLFSVDPTEADDIFLQLLKWLWLCALAREHRKEGREQVPQSLHVVSGLIIVDELWHTFILHTRDYAEFCDSHLDAYLHHYPGNPDYRPPTETETESERQLSYIYDHLDGEVTLTKWFIEYADKYGPERIASLARPREFGRPCEQM